MKKVLVIFAALGISSMAEEEPLEKQLELSFQSVSEHNYKLLWEGRPEDSYFVEFSQTLQKGSWTFFPVIEQGVGSYVFNFSITDPKTFVRLHLTTVPMADPATFDLDGDGWGNMFELQILATSPFLKDTDADGILDGAESMDGDMFSDAWEMLYFGDLTTLGQGDEYGDLDGDGISNLFESRMRTDPNADQSIVPASASGGAREEFTYTLLGRLEGVSGEKSMSFTFDDEGNMQTAN